jgi:hypothetical protein
MSRSLVTTIGVLAILSGSLLPLDRAAAGASASAPSKYGHASQVATVHQAQVNRQARRNDFAITEYSSSSARRSVPKR